MSEPKPTVAGEDLSTRSSASASDLLKERAAQPVESESLVERVEASGPLVERVEASGPLVERVEASESLVEPIETSEPRDSLVELVETSEPRDSLVELVETPPRAKKVPTRREFHGDVFVDHYEWMRAKDDPEVIAYLEAQNAYTEVQTAPLESLRKDIFNEIRSRTKETDMSVPVRSGRYWYYVRTEEGKSYAIRCRCPISGDDDWTPPEISPETPIEGEQVLLDSNVEAEGHEYFALGAHSVSHDGRLLAYSTDTVGDERYTLRIKDLETGELLPDVITGTAGGATWSKDGRHLFYLTVDEAWRPDTVWRHDVGAGNGVSGPDSLGAGNGVSGPDSLTGAQDAKVFHEPDERFWVGFGATHSDEYLMVVTGSKLTSEVFTLSMDDPTGDFVSVAGRTEGVEYSVEHARLNGEDYFVIVHNGEVDGVKAVDFAVDAMPVGDPSARRTLVGPRPSFRIEDVDCFADYLVLSYREDALPRLAIADLRGRTGLPGAGDFVPVTFEQELCSVGLGANPEWNAPHLRLGYASFVEPAEVLDLDVSTGERTLLKRAVVLGDFDPADYVATREWALAADGTRIPVSVVRRADVSAGPEGRPSGPMPLLLNGYGAYEISSDPGFSVSALSLLDRGVAVATAHVRGGGEMGRDWYEGGRELNKRNTFTDFIAVARHLVDAGWTTPDQMVADGGSAGGLLMGAVANMAPELFGGILAAVPFVDPLTSILDPTLPLTVTEWEEWGDPLHDAEVYHYIRKYSPYENVAPRPYPAMLILNSLHDTRVLFTEAAKWAARLQEATMSDNPILLRTEMNGGHGGPSGRYKQWEEAAFELAWILRQSGAVSI
ncbi:oligopeptidase B [Gordonia iterans]|uniref:Oligopeptidase B n=1 Tax=Gordonia iterans TaxID=1004901 RepID=A0A2S0KJB9_9ACTN|nr:oligopeptidase B [Gordonia iterans]